MNEINTKLAQIDHSGKKLNHILAMKCSWIRYILTLLKNIWYAFFSLACTHAENECLILVQFFVSFKEQLEVPHEYSKSLYDSYPKTHNS